MRKFHRKSLPGQTLEKGIVQLTNCVVVRRAAGRKSDSEKHNRLVPGSSPGGPTNKIYKADLALPFLVCQFIISLFILDVVFLPCSLYGISKMIKTIFFDFDGVLTIGSSGSYTTCTNIQKEIPDVSFEHIIQCYRVYHPQLLLGQTTHAAMWKDFCACVGKDLNIKILHEAFRNSPVNVEMIELCKKLKGKYRLGIITDNSKERLDLLKQELSLPDMFETILVSGETGIRKDSDATFIQALDLTGNSPEECVFIDNNASNLTAPKKLGWKTIFYDDTKNDINSLIKELQTMGVSVD